MTTEHEQRRAWEFARAFRVFLWYCRQRHGVTQYRIAERMQVDQYVLSKLKKPNGRGGPREEIVLHIALGGLCDDRQLARRDALVDALRSEDFADEFVRALDSAQVSSSLLARRTRIALGRIERFLGGSILPTEAEVLRIVATLYLSRAQVRATNHLLTHAWLYLLDESDDEDAA